MNAPEPSSQFDAAMGEFSRDSQDTKVLHRIKTDLVKCKTINLAEKKENWEIRESAYKTMENIIFRAEREAK